MGLVLRRVLLWVVLPLGAGAAIYAWSKPGVAFLVALERQGLTWPRPRQAGPMAMLLADRAPDALWAFAFVAFLALVWFDGRESRRRCLAWGTLGGIYEIGQGLGIAPGQFDGVDLIVSVVAGTAAALGVRWTLTKGRTERP